MNRRGAMLLGLLSPLPVLSAFGWPQFFDLSWEEEVQLHDGRVIVVRLKYTYERLSGLSRYGRTILRNSEVSFDAGAPHGVVTQVFKRQRPVFLDQKDGRWFIVLDQRGDISLVRDEDWGNIQNGSGQRVGLLSADSRFHPTPIAALPSEFTLPNFVYDVAGAEELAKFDGTRVTLAQKREYLQTYPLGPGQFRIERPRRRMSQ